jgi:hypothetical protein
VLRIVELLLTLVKLWVVRIVVSRVLAPRARRVVCSRCSDSDTTVGVETQTCELGENIGVPVKRQLRTGVEAIAMVIGSPSQRLDGLVEILQDLSPMLEGPSFVLTSPSLSLPFSFSGPSRILTLVSPSLRDESTGDASGQGAHYANAGYYQRHPEWSSTHVSMMEASTIDLAEAGHVGGTSPRELPGSDENG